MYGVVFQGPRPNLSQPFWIATVCGYAAEGRTKRHAQEKLKAAVPAGITNIRWVKHDSPFLKR